MIYVIVKDLPDVVSFSYQTEQLLRLSFVLLIGILNLILQTFFLIWIMKFVMLPSIRTAQDVYEEFHRKTSVDFSDDEFEGHKDQLCGLVLGNYKFMYAVLFLWMCRGANEFLKCHRLVRYLNALPWLPSGCTVQDQVHEEAVDDVLTAADEEDLRLVCLNGGSRMALFILVVIPKIVIAGCLLVMGLVWLTASPAYTDLILNSLALGFVLDIDSLLYETFLPARLHQSIEHMSFAMPLKAKEDESADIVQAYIRSGVVLTICLVGIAVFLQYQPVVPGYDWDVYHYCKSFILEKQAVWCFSFTVPEEGCFPYGGDTIAKLDNALSVEKLGDTIEKSRRLV